MAKEKVTLTLDRAKAETARSVLKAPSTSAAVDMALDRVIRAERLRADIAAYRRTPPTEDEVQLALLASAEDLADDVDWESLYDTDRP